MFGLGAIHPDRPAAVRAVELATRACELTRWKEPNFIDTLAAAHAEAGEFAKAIEVQTQALDFPDIDKRDGPQMRRQLELYRENRPYRDPTLKQAGPERGPLPREVK